MTPVWKISLLGGWWWFHSSLITHSASLSFFRNPLARLSRCQCRKKGTNPSNITTTDLSFQFIGLKLSTEPFYFKRIKSLLSFRRYLKGSQVEGSSTPENYYIAIFTGLFMFVHESPYFSASKVSSN